VSPVTGNREQTELNAGDKGVQMGRNGGSDPETRAALKPLRANYIRPAKTRTTAPGHVTLMLFIWNTLILLFIWNTLML